MFLKFAVNVVAVVGSAGAGSVSDRVVVCAVGARFLIVVQGSSGVPGELTLMPDVDSLGVVEENMTSPHESIGWLQL